MVLLSFNCTEQKKKNFIVDFNFFYSLLYKSIECFCVSLTPIFLIIDGNLNFKLLILKKKNFIDNIFLLFFAFLLLLTNNSTKKLYISYLPLVYKYSFIYFKIDLIII